MKWIELKNEYYVFDLGKSEKAMLFDLLKLYPAARSRKATLILSTEENGPSEAQKLLEDSLAARKRENQKQLAALLEQNGRFIESGESFTVSLKREEMEWLLQVLNDIRVGAWLALGSPDLERTRDLRLTAENAQWAWAMELAGYFEMSLLNALNGNPYA